MIFDPEIVERAAAFITHIATVMQENHPGHHVPSPDGARHQASAILHMAFSPTNKHSVDVMTVGCIDPADAPRPMSREVKSR